ncbi:phosphate transport system permease protein PstC [Cutibacterium acnes JCM 18918]|nr:phosphate transport system permease protein PstC [Cutibacterium acnes JCM 18918]
MGIALFITQLAPRKLASPVAFVVDLLAAVPRSSSVCGAASSSDRRESSTVYAGP